MDDTNYGAAIWGFTRGDVSSEEGAVQGFANLTDNSIILDLPFGRLLGDPGIRVIGKEAKPTEVDNLFGFSQDGYHLALKEAHSLGTTEHIPGGGSQRIGARYLLASRGEFDPNREVVEIQLKVTGLREWFARSPVGMRIDPNTYRVLAITYDLENEESYNQVIFDNEDMTLEIDHQTTIAGLTCAGSSMDHDCTLLIDLKRHLSFDDSINLTHDIARFFTYCLGFIAEVKELKLRFGGCDDLAFCHSSFLRASDPSPSDILFIPFKLSTIGDSAGSYISAWLNADGDLRSARDMIVSLMLHRWDMSIDLRFIAASQALEALTRVNADPLSMPPDKYDKYVSTVKDSIADKAVLKWISERMPSNNKGQSRRLKEFLETYSAFADWLIGDVGRFAKENARLRNGYAHRDLQSMSIDEGHYEMLYWHTECVLMLCYGVIWQLLGMDASTFIGRMKNSGFRNHQLYKIRGLYGGNENA